MMGKVSQVNFRAFAKDVYISGLAFWSEQAFESVHADFKLYWESMKVDMDHPEYLAKLLACIVRWNARHI